MLKYTCINLYKGLIHFRIRMRDDYTTACINLYKGLKSIIKRPCSFIGFLNEQGRFVVFCFIYWLMRSNLLYPLLSVRRYLTLITLPMAPSGFARISSGNLLSWRLPGVPFASKLINICLFPDFLIKVITASDSSPGCSVTGAFPRELP